ncbi:pseudaminic acid cytidylyltransferase [Rhodohalobacter mucosus]|uniref:Pseudaminic acid cytidylyltransferase n=1 Tax=Rhodohalobacter mucosus TaxID=2079485 RepID=A0A316TUE8_9BACT|nr:pseudaminic acid cytidylyltransferase [Rhodohalobacter mucosus]PWN07458.1 pseudaminic acid cytidylyltransferase [Rhodohalobacter mucosus]
MKNIAIIPARGGSKRIPRKNIRDFLGKPIIAYSIETALESGLFDEVMVSTDDFEIAEISEKYRAKVPFLRSEETADDYATTVNVLLEVLKTYQKQGKKFEYGCCIYPTAPLLKPSIIKSGYKKLMSESFSTVFPVVEFSYPILRSLKLSGNDKVEMNWPEHQESRSQDLPKAYHDAGQFYWFNVEEFLKEEELFGKNSGALILPNTSVQDIDTEEDWKLAEMKAKLSE